MAFFLFVHWILRWLYKAYMWSRISRYFTFWEEMTFAVFNKRNNISKIKKKMQKWFSRCHRTDLAMQRLIIFYFYTMKIWCFSFNLNYSNSSLHFYISGIRTRFFFNIPSCSFPLDLTIFTMHSRLRNSLSLYTNSSSHPFDPTRNNLF